VVTTALYLLLLYLPIPALCKALGFSAVLGFFWPIHAQEVQLWPVAVELALVAVWLRGRFAAAARVTPGSRPAPDPAP
jgi:hypothetical protein